MTRAKKRQDGLYQVSVTITERGKKVRKYFYGRTQQEAKRKMMNYQNKLEAGRTFEEVANEWEEEHFQEIEAGTQASYSPALKRALETFGNMDISSISPLDVKRSAAKMGAQGYAHHTVSIYLCVLNQIFDYAIQNEDITENPAATIKVPKGLKTGARELPTDEQLEIIKTHTDEEFGLFPFFLLYTGLRRGEALALQWKDIDFGNRTISVTKSVTYAEGNQPIIKGTKTKSGNRDVILLDRLAVKLFPRQEKKSYYVFGGKEPLTETIYRHKWRNYCLSTGMYEEKTQYKREGRKRKVVTVKTPNITPHQLRHAFATILFEAGISERDAMGLMGHNNIAVTQDTYTHIRKSHMEETARKLNKVE